MNPANVPPWGCPWHGRVQSGILSLPNSGWIYYQQPLPTFYMEGSTERRPHDTYGITHRHAAGLAPIARTPSEQAADDAAGRQWRSEAILSGGRLQVHGKTIDGWIYIDSAGARWLVSCADINEQNIRSLAAPLVVTVVLSRFGMLGGAPESYSYEVSLPLDGIGSSTSAYLMLDAFKPAGSAAIINVHQRVFDRRMQRVPYGFLEMTISGPGAGAVIGCAVVRTQAQTHYADPAPTPTRLWLVVGPGSTEYFDVEPASFTHVVFELEATFTRRSERIFALWYDAAELINELVLRVDASYTYSAPRAPVSAESGVGNYTNTASFSGSAQWVVGGAVVESLPVAATMQVAFADNKADWVFSSTIDGVTLNGSSQSSPLNWLNLPFPEIGYTGPLSGTTVHNGASTSGLSVLSFRPDLSTNLSPTYAGAVLYRATIYPYWHSRQVVGFELSTENGAPHAASRRWRFRAPVTPSGAASGSTIDITTPTGPTFYGSHDPYSGAAVWGQSTPVCYV